MSESLTLDGWRVGGVDSSDAAAEIAALEDVLREPDSRAEPVSGRRYRRGALVRRTLLVADVGAFVLAFVLATALVRPSETSGGPGHPGLRVRGVPPRHPGWVLLLRLEGLYDRDEERTDHSTVDDIVGVFRSVTIGVWVFALSGSRHTSCTRARSARGLLAVRRRPDPDAARRRPRELCRHLPGYTQNAVIVGAGNVGQQLALKLHQPS